VAYVEWLRVRRRLVPFTIVLAVLAALIVLPLVFGHAYKDSHGAGMTIGVGSGPGRPAPDALHDLTAQWHVPLSALFGVAAVLCLSFATTLGTSLNAAHESLNLAFTRPVSRERLALMYFGVDAAAIVACFAVSLSIVCFVPFLALGLLDRVYLDGDAPLAAVFAIGASVMLYGVLQAATAWARGSTALIVGFAWPVFVIASIPGTPPFGPIAGGVLAIVRFLDPLVYLRTASAYVALPLGLGAGPLVTATVTVWAIGIAGCALATFEWRRLEV